MGVVEGGPNAWVGGTRTQQCPSGALSVLLGSCVDVDEFH